MPEGSVVFSKIAATATDAAWSQAYSAGKLFTVLSLKKESSKEEKEENSLKAAGKNTLDTLETEFFSLEEKNLESIRGAIEAALKVAPEDLEISFVTAVLSNNILYTYIVGRGEVFIKRVDKFGYVLQSEEKSRDISSASGFLQDGDLIILATEGFINVVSKEELSSSLENLIPSEIAENLAPGVHESEEAGAAAIFLSYKEEVEAHEAVATEEELPTKDTASSDKTIEKAIEEDENRKLNPLGFITSFLAIFKKLIPGRLNHSKKIYLTIAVLILIVLVASVLLAVKKQSDAKIDAAFNAVYPQAEKKYEDGESLKDLNKNLALDSFKQAQKILSDNKNKFPANSKQEKQINSLLTKVNSEIANNSPSAGSTNLDKSKITITVENGSGVEGAAGKVSDYLKGLGYNVSGTSNADNYNYTGVTIKVKSSVSNYFDTLKSDLSKNYTVSLSSSDLPASSPTDAVVIIGK